MRLYAAEISGSSGERRRRANCNQRGSSLTRALLTASSSRGGRRAAPYRNSGTLIFMHAISPERKRCVIHPRVRCFQFRISLRCMINAFYIVLFRYSTETRRGYGVYTLAIVYRLQSDGSSRDDRRRDSRESASTGGVSRAWGRRRESPERDFYAEQVCRSKCGG